MKTRFAPSSGLILVPRMELRTVEGLGIFHTLSETSVEMGYEGFPLISPQPRGSPQYSTILTLGSLPYTQPTSNYFWHIVSPSSTPDSSIYSLPTTSLVQINLLFIIIMALLHARHLKGKRGRMNETEPLLEKKSQPVGGGSYANNCTEEINKQRIKSRAVEALGKLV